MNSELVESILAGLPLPVMLIGAEERVRTMNSAAERMFGAGAKGRSYITVLRQPALLDCVEETLRLRQSRKTRYWTAEVAGDATFEVSCSPVSGGGESGAVLMFVDITEREQAGEIRRDFVANVSHELKTPLTALLGYIETLRGPARDDAPARERFLATMEREAGRMNRLVGDLLSLSRVEGEERLRPSERVDLAGLVHSAATTLHSLAAESGVEVEIAAAEEVPAVRGDPDQLLQVFTNLLENSLKYGAAGGRVRIELTSRSREAAFRGPAVEVAVVDFGDGFDPVHIPRLTERFYRVDNHRSREMGGTGLGLAICKHIVNRHRGRFRIESRPGEGSRFTVMLPAA